MMTATAALRRYLDSVSVLTLFLVLCAVPTYLTITVIGAVGRPVVLLCMAMMAWWVAHQLQRPFAEDVGPQPLKWLLLGLVAAFLMSYASAMFRGLPPAEISPADTGLLRLAGWCGLFLVAHDGIRSWWSLRTIVRRIVWAGGLMAALGLAQFALKNSLLAWVTIPGMSGDSIGGVDLRAGFVRAAGTASHPLEYGVVLCSVLPLSLVLAAEDKDRSAVARWWPAVCIAAASVLSVSRAALIAVFMVVVVLAITWTARQRIAAGMAGIVLFGAVYTAVPGMAGTLVGMFAGISGDTSVASRVNSYDVAFGMIGRQPVLGRGYGTLLPSYVYLDNQYLGLAVEVGLLGLAVFVALAVTGAVGVWRARRLAPARLESQIGSALAASVISTSVTFSFFDVLSFPLSAAFFFLVLGLSGAYRRMARRGDQEQEQDEDAQARATPTEPTETDSLRASAAAAPLRSHLHET